VLIAVMTTFACAFAFEQAREALAFEVATVRPSHPFDRADEPTLDRRAAVPAPRGLQTGKPFNPSYPAKFLDSVKEQWLFDNLKSTRSENNANAENRIVNVTLYFNK